jgi:radical SAM superfamily enzyme YgiQ (UPF0313 family)
MDSLPETMKKPLVLLVYTQRLILGRTFEMIGNLGTLTLAAQLDADGFEAYAYTGIATDVFKTIERMKPRLFAVCFYCDFDNQSAVAAIIKGLKNEAGNDFHVVLGGPQTLHMTEHDLERFGADAVIKGEGEESLPAWLRARRTGATAAVPGELLSGKSAEYIYLEDFSKYPLPRDDAAFDYAERPLMSVITARGCPYRCAFCFEGGNSKNLRMRAADDVLHEIETRLRRSRGPRYLFFCDDTFTADPKRLAELLKGVRRLRERHDFVWFCEGHPGFLARRPELIREMIKSGMVRMQIGMESGVDHVLQAYGKRALPEDVKNVVDICYGEGLPQLAGNFIIGGAFETRRTLETTTRFALDLLYRAPGMLDLSTTFLMPLPGTRISTNPESFDIALEDPDCLTSIEDFPVNRTRELSVPELCRERSLFLTHISNAMKEQYANGRIPPERIRRDFELAFRYGIAAGYLKFLYGKDPVVVAYYRKLFDSEGLLKEWRELEGEEKERCFIQRVPDFSLVDFAALSAAETEILLEAGSSSVKETARMLKLSMEATSACLERLSAQHLTLFSPCR